MFMAILRSGRLDCFGVDGVVHDSMLDPELGLAQGKTRVHSMNPVVLKQSIRRKRVATRLG
jgi:hypothetical protein